MQRLAEGIEYALGAELPGRSAARPRTTNHEVLTPRESQVAALVGQGLSDKEIAKLDFTSRTQLAAWIALGSSTPRS